MSVAGDRGHAALFAQSLSESRALTSFIEWLEQGGKFVCEADEVGEWRPKAEPHEKTLARFFGIDMDAVERHRVRLLRKMQEQA